MSESEFAGKAPESGESRADGAAEVGFADDCDPVDDRGVHRRRAGAPRQLLAAHARRKRRVIEPRAPDSGGDRASGGSRHCWRRICRRRGLIKEFYLRLWHRALGTSRTRPGFGPPSRPRRSSCATCGLARGVSARTLPPARGIPRGRRPDQIRRAGASTKDQIEGARPSRTGAEVRESEAVAGSRDDRRPWRTGQWIIVGKVNSVDAIRLYSWFWLILAPESRWLELWWRFLPAACPARGGLFQRGRSTKSLPDHARSDCARTSMPYLYGLGFNPGDCRSGVPQAGRAESRISGEGIAIEIVPTSTSPARWKPSTFNSRARTSAGWPPSNTSFRSSCSGSRARSIWSGRPDDLIGLVAFGGFADSKCPLTLDHGALVDIVNGGLEIP